MSASITAGLTQEALILRLRSTEHDFVERKSRNDKGGWLQSVVAFANSAPIGWPACLFVGIDDEGKPQQDRERLEDLAKSVSDVLEQAYPAIYRYVVPLHFTDGACLAVIVPGSEARPHFAGKSYIRVGPQTKEASESQFDRLIADRVSKAREISKWVGKRIVIDFSTPRSTPDVILQDCNQFYLTYEVGSPAYCESVPLSRVQISFDSQKNTLRLEIQRWFT